MAFKIENDIVRMSGVTPRKMPVGLADTYHHYVGCVGLSVSTLRRALSYDPEMGTLRWIGSYTGSSRGGAQRGEPIVRSSFMVDGIHRNTIGVIYLLQTGALPEDRVPFRNGDANDWTWENISPAKPGEGPYFTVQPMRGRNSPMPRTKARSGM